MAVRKMKTELAHKGPAVESHECRVYHMPRQLSAGEKQQVLPQPGWCGPGCKELGGHICQECGEGWRATQAPCLEMSWQDSHQPSLLPQLYPSSRTHSQRARLHPSSIPAAGPTAKGPAPSRLHPGSLPAAGPSGIFQAFLTGEQLVLHSVGQSSQHPFSQLSHSGRDQGLSRCPVIEALSSVHGTTSGKPPLLRLLQDWVHLPYRAMSAFKKSVTAAHTMDGQLRDKQRDLNNPLTVAHMQFVRCFTAATRRLSS